MGTQLPLGKKVNGIRFSQATVTEVCGKERNRLKILRDRVMGYWSLISDIRKHINSVHIILIFL